MELEQICRNAKKTSKVIATMDTHSKNQLLLKVAEQLITDTEQILSANEKDIKNAKENGMSDALLDRLMLNEKRIRQMSEGLIQIAALEDPIGEMLYEKIRPNGLRIGKKRVPLGVVGIIYEARPNVTTDAFGLCFKTGNVVILKGGSDAIFSNIAIVASIRKTLKQQGLPEELVSLIEDTSRETTTAFMKMNQYVDVLIPRGGANLIQTVVKQATIPVIETGTGNCHIYVDESADIEMAIKIIMNAKTQRIGVCNACESLVVHEAIVEELMPKLAKQLQTKQVELRVDEKIYQRMQHSSEQVDCTKIKMADEEDWGKEYLDLILSAKTVQSVEEAIAHINQYNTGHSEAIITNDYTNAEQFLNEVNAACVYVNASTRFTDGYEFGFGAEIGISTQKLHVRGPMGLEALTSTKYVIRGNGQVRP